MIKVFYLIGISIILSTSLFAQTDTILVDFGNMLSPPPWNNLTNAKIGANPNLINHYGLSSGISIAVVDSFNNVNSNGTQMPDIAIGFPATATGDTFWGNTVPFGGDLQPKGALLLGNLDTALEYTLTIFSSRVANDNRETEYIISGLERDTFYLDVASNTDMVVHTSLFPAPDGTILIEAAPGPNNNNTNGFFYIGALKLAYESDMPPPTATLDLLSPNGNEYWQVGKPVSILWESLLVNELVLEYSTDAGSSWNVIDTVSGFSGAYEWIVPDTPSFDCLVRVSADTLADQSDHEFEIARDTTVCKIAILGSSTAAGAGPSTSDSTWVNRYRKALYQKDTRFEIHNLAVGGFTTYHVLPTGTPIPTGVGISINENQNITKALSFDPYAILINMPSNDSANNFPVADQLNNFDLLFNTGTDAGVWTYVCTTQPRNFGNPAQVDMQREVRDSIFAKYGPFAIDFWSGFADDDGFILPDFNSGDGVHMNDAAHRLLFERVSEKQIDTLCNTVITDISEVETFPALPFRVYPNPFRDIIHIQFHSTGVEEVELRLFDVYGKFLAAKKELFVPEGTHQIDWQLSNGMQVSGSFLFLQIRVANESGVSIYNKRLVRMAN